MPPPSMSEKRARKTDDDGDLKRVLLLIGRLNYAWTNTESLLIHLIAGLAKTDKDAAIIIFLTLNTPRARLDLVERLAKSGRLKAPVRDALLAITSGMSDILRVRNHYNHCLYSFDQSGNNAKTILLRVSDQKDKIKFGKTMLLDEAEMTNVDLKINEIEQINKLIWAFIKTNNFPV